jgi:hypothetical protein
MSRPSVMDPVHLSVSISVKIFRLDTLDTCTPSKKGAG